MNQFVAYLLLGWEHILDLNGYDHVLFLVALLAGHAIKDWKRILLLVTAFTLGHMVTLIHTAWHGPILPSEWVEFLIPATILLTGVRHITTVNFHHTSSTWVWEYALTAFFGLIHGMGFSGYFRSLIGSDQEALIPLLAFNTGIEIGQLAAVSVIMAFQYLVARAMPGKTQLAGILLSIVACIFSTHLLFNRLPW